jgi:hypothetical protein
MAKHIEQPRQTIRRGLPEVRAKRIRISKQAWDVLGDRVDETGKPVWVIVNELLGVA